MDSTQDLSKIWQPVDPSFGDSTNYPDKLVVGDTLFPLLYIYYHGDTKMKARVGNEDLFKQGLKQWFDKQKDMGQAMNQSGNAPSNFEQFDRNIVKFNKMLISAEKKNPTFFYQINNAVSQIMAQYNSQIPKTRGNYYSGRDGVGTSYFPILDPNDSQNLFNIMETLRLLYENSIIPFDYELGIRPISLYDGSFATLNDEVVAQQKNARILGLPVKGAFTINKTPGTPWMYRTFTGIDIIAVASMNSVVSRLEGITSISWSIHRGKTTQRPLGKIGPSGRAGGTRTVAGTMIFTMADHNPLLDILPDELPLRKKNAIPQSESMWRPIMSPDQFPPFDIMVIMDNEYGYSSAFTLYGVEFTDEGGVISTDNMAIEVVYQYTAVAMDPIVQAQKDENGFIDPYGLLQGGYSQFWKQREVVINGVAYSDLHEAYESQYESVDATIDGINRMRAMVRQGSAVDLGKYKLAGGSAAELARAQRVLTEAKVQ